LRIGFAIGHPDLIEALIRVKDSFNSYPLDSLAIAAGVEAFADEEYFKTTCDRVIQSREFVVSGLTQLGFSVIPSAANFVFVKHDDHDAETLASGLRQQGVIVRHFNHERIVQYLRITIGTEEENQRLLTVLGDLIIAQ